METNKNGEEYSLLHKIPFLSIEIFLLFFSAAIVGGLVIDKYFRFDLGVILWISSTIIQSIAALIALVAMFYIYRMQPLMKRKNEIGSVIRETEKEAYSRMYLIPDYILDKAPNISDDEMKQSLGNKQYSIYQQNKTLYYKKKKLIHKMTYLLKESLFWAVLTITVSLLALPFGKLTSSDYSTNMPIISVTITVIIFLAIFTVFKITFYLEKVIEL